MVHGPQFAYCPSPQGRCPQPFPSSSPRQAQLCFWPDPGWAVPGSPRQGGPCEDGAIMRVLPLPSSAPAAGCPRLPLHRQRGALP